MKLNEKALVKQIFPYFGLTEATINLQNRGSFTKRHEKAETYLLLKV